MLLKSIFSRPSIPRFPRTFETILFKYEPIFFYFKDLYEDCKKEHNALVQYLSREEFINRLSFFEFKNNIINL